MSDVQAAPHVLVYTATAGFRHDSIPTAIETFRELGPQNNISFTFSEDPAMFTNSTLSTFDAVLFALNSDEVLNSTGQAALQTYFQSGGVYIGIHSASACLFNDTTYRNAVGALFDYHPSLQSATFERLNDTHPATALLPDRWTYTEEIYYFRSDPRSQGAVVLMTVDNSSYTDDGLSTGDYPPQGSPHPISWYIESSTSALPLLPGATIPGRSFYTALGHLNSTWQNATFQQHIMGGITWALEGASTRAYGKGLVGNGTSSSGGGSATTLSSTGSSSTATGSSAPSSTSARGSSTSAASTASQSTATGGSARKLKAFSGAGIGFGIGAAFAIGVLCII